MPFVTEELWQTVAPIAGKSGNSICTQRFPKFGADRVNAEANAKMALLKQIVSSCRTLRSEMKISPAERVPMICTGDAATLKEFSPYEVTKAEAKLGNPAFADKAPPAVVAQERERLVGFVSTLEKVAAQRKNLG